MSIGTDAIGTYPIASSADSDSQSLQAKQFSIVASLTSEQPIQEKQLSAITSLTINQPIQAKQISVLTSLASNQPVQAKQLAIIISMTAKKIRRYSYARPIRIAQASPLYSLWDAPTDNRDI